MANEHVKILKQGAEVWNAWRKDNPDVLPSLGGADLRGAYLNGTDLREVYLGEAQYV